MSIGSFFKNLLHTAPAAVAKAEAAAPAVNAVLTAAEKAVSILMPHVGDELLAFSKTLPSEFNSLLVLGQTAKEVVEKVTGQPISLSLAIHLAQAVLTGGWPQVVTEAETILPHLIAFAAEQVGPLTASTTSAAVPATSATTVG